MVGYLAYSSYRLDSLPCVNMSHSLVRTRLACYNLIMILVQNLKYLFGAQDTQRCCPDLDNNLTARICNALATFFPKDNISYVPSRRISLHSLGHYWKGSIWKIRKRYHQWTWKLQWTSKFWLYWFVRLPTFVTYLFSLTRNEGIPQFTTLVSVPLWIECDGKV